MMPQKHKLKLLTGLNTAIVGMLSWSKAYILLQKNQCDWFQPLLAQIEQALFDSVCSFNILHYAYFEGLSAYHRRCFNSKNRFNSLEVICNSICNLFETQILRWTRKWIVINDLVTKGFKAETIRKTLDILFKLFILTSDFNDIFHYVHYIKLRDNQASQLKFRKMNLDFYFIECCLWLCFYTHDLSKQPAENKVRRKELVLYIIKYILDMFVSHNDFSHAFFKLEPKPIAFFGFVSSIIAMYLSWK